MSFNAVSPSWVQHLHFRRSHFRPYTPLLRLATVVVLCTNLLPSARGDVFQLKSGGQVTGAIVDRGQQEEYVVASEQGAVITLSRRQVAKVVPQDKIDWQYEAHSRALPDTVEAHRELADWCRQNRLAQQTKHHLRRIIELDPTDEAARLSLGYQQHRGRWLTREEIMMTRGLQHYDGDYRTSQDIELRERTKQREQAENDWFRKIRTWIGWLGDRRAAEAADLIAGVNDPLAAPAIVKLLSKQNSQRVRNLLTRTLAALEHPAAVTTLVDLSLYDPDREVRLQCLDYLLQYHQPLRLKPYVDALDEKRSENEIINRAADALRQIGDPQAISPLIDALVTTHKFKNPNAAPGNLNPTFSSGGGGGRGGGLSMGGDKHKIIKRNLQNLSVRQALVELSGGQDYEFDEKLWRMWFVNEQIHDYVDARRDQ